MTRLDYTHQCHQLAHLRSCENVICQSKVLARFSYQFFVRAPDTNVPSSSEADFGISDLSWGFSDQPRFHWDFTRSMEANCGIKNYLMISYFCRAQFILSVNYPTQAINEARIFIKYRGISVLANFPIGRITAIA